MNALDGESDFEPEEVDASGSEDDFEHCCEARDRVMQVDDEDGGDHEPSLGALTCVGGWSKYGINSAAFDQTGWAWGNRSDAEDEHDGTEPDAEAWSQPSTLEANDPPIDVAPGSELAKCGKLLIGR